MRFSPTAEEFARLAHEGNLIPVTTDLMADFETPVSVYSKLRATGPAFLLESIEGGSTVNRYSFIGCQPQTVIEATLGGESIIRTRDGHERRLPTPADPLTLIQEEMAPFRPVKLHDMPRFIGGAVGYLSYDYVHAVEPTVPLAERDVLKMPTLHFLITDTLVIFDRARQTLRLLVNAHVKDPEDAATAYAAACRSLDALARQLAGGREVPTVPVESPRDIRVPGGNFTQAAFEEMVDNCKEYIRAGDVIQIVGSQRFEKDFAPSPLSLYRSLRVVNPSPYMFLYDPGPFALVGASPEVHVRLTDGKAEMRPIAGTRPRGATPTEDAAHESDLLADEKERAEHLMLVDLARNDLGRVCRFGSVTVPEYMIVEHYSHVMHIVSQVEGILSPDHNAYDLMRSTFPAGTVSGAPKVRAMQIIAEQEREMRGPYAGAVCYISYDGNVDSCITIRTALMKDGRIYIQSGAGIVSDSVPEKEYEETVNKARAMFKAVAIAEQMGPTPGLD